MGGNKKYIVKYLFAWTAILFIIIGCKVVDNYAYEISDEYLNYKEYNSLRAELLDHGFPDYNENFELYNELNISEEDLRLFENWNFADPDVFNISSMQQLVDAKETKYFNFSLLGDYSCTILHGLIFEHGFIIYCMLAVVLVLLDRKIIIALFWNVIVYSAVEFYFYYTDRYLLHRVETVMWFAQCVLILYICRVTNAKIKIMTSQMIMVILITLLFNSNVYVDKINSLSDTNDKIVYRDILQEINRDSDHLYVLPTLDDLVNKSYDALDVLPYGIRNNVTLLGGWGIDLPIENDILNRFGISNIFRDLINNPNVYIVGSGDMQSILAYIQRHYNPNAHFECVKKIGTYTVNRIVAE